MSPATTPKRIYVEVSTYCNLRCKMCVKFIEGSCIPEHNFNVELFDTLLPDLQNADCLILNGIGEPLIHPQLLRFIQKARQQMGNREISFQSNGLLLTKERADALLQSGLSSICLSVDLLEKKDGEHSFTAINKAVSILEKSRKKINPHFKIGLETVVSKANYTALPELVHWACDNKIDHVLVSHLIRYDESSENADLFNPNSHGSVTLYEKYKERAEREKIDFDDAQKRYRISYYVELSEAETSLLKDLRNEAHKLDMRINIPNLIERDIACKGIEPYFQEAKTIAHHHNLTLDLPPLHALDKRRCRFMEDNAVCISVEGEVTPCHYLWHTYSCRVHREEVKVQKRSFGHLKNMSLQNIWQTPAYTAFRKEALEYKYTHCWNCTQGPCPDLVSADTDLGHDCYGSNVPCGHCQWNLGGVRCL